MKTLLEDSARRLAERWLEGRGIELPRDGVTVVRLGSPTRPLRDRASSLARLCAKLESAGARSPSWLTLATLQARLWPTEHRRVLLTIDRPTYAQASSLSQITEEFGWTVLVFLDATDPFLSSAWGEVLTGSGLTCGAFWPQQAGVPTAHRLVEGLSRLRGLCGYTPRHLAGDAPERMLEVLARVGRECGCEATFGARVGLASARDDFGVQPRVPWNGTRDDDRVLAWVAGDTPSLARSDLRSIATTFVRNLRDVR